MGRRVWVKKMKIRGREVSLKVHVPWRKEEENAIAIVDFKSYKNDQKGPVNIS
jgi:hypothetical protein